VAVTVVGNYQIGYVPVVTDDPISSLYPVFTVGANDDEFNDSNFSGWTTVNSGSFIPTIIESNHVASIVHPGGGAAGDLWAYMKSYTPSVNDYIEMAFNMGGYVQNYNAVGLIMADGVTWTAGKQIVCYARVAAPVTVISSFTGYNTDLSGPYANALIASIGHGLIFIRLKYEGSSHFRGYISPDGISWVEFTTQATYAMTPTYIGFVISPQAGANPFMVSVYYFKQSA